MMTAYPTLSDIEIKWRKAGSAPRNSYELAFRNQFYTPRYVVAFLVDNTLGRLAWIIGPTLVAALIADIVLPWEFIGWWAIGLCMADILHIIADHWG